MKFTISWTECHNPENWGDTAEEGIKKILDSYPYVHHWIEPDGWLDGNCAEEFEAKSIEEAKKHVEDYFEAEVFNVYLNGKIVFTEEGDY